MSKLPSFQFYPGDWRKDANLSRCSKAAKGVWIDMLCLMFECPIRGVLADANGEPWSDQEIAEAVGGPTDSNLGCIAELLSKGVAHRNDRGAIFSRRLVRDEATRRATAVRVKKHRSNGSVTPDVTPLYEVEEEIEIEVDVGSKQKTKEVLVSLELSTPEELIYADYPRKVGRVKALQSIGKATKKVAKEFQLNEHEAAEFLHKAVIEFARSPAGKKGEYTPHCATWMNQERWNDDRKEWYRDTSSQWSGPQAVTKAQQRQDANIEAARAAIARITGVDSEGTDGTGDGNERERDYGDARVICEAPVGPHPITLEGSVRKMP